MGRVADLEDDEAIISRHVVFTEQLFELVMKDARKHTGGNLSMVVRRILREYYGIPEKD
jgi:hypothetical protein